MFHCPKCGKEYHCACGSCKGEGWKMSSNDIMCLNCGLKKSISWWFQLQEDINNK